MTKLIGYPKMKKTYSRDLNDLLNVNHTTTNGLTTRHLLSWDGSQWIRPNETPVDLSTHSINELMDVTTDACHTRNWYVSQMGRRVRLESSPARHSLNRLVGHLREYTSVRWSDVDLQRNEE